MRGMGNYFESARRVYPTTAGGSATGRQVESVGTRRQRREVKRSTLVLTTKFPKKSLHKCYVVFEEVKFVLDPQLI